MNKSKVQICIVGWHFFSDFYKKLSQSKYEVYIVAHRYNKILDKLNFNYSVTKNIGLEYGAYNWFVKNIWDRESNILLSHDDTSVSSTDVIDSMISKCKKYDRVYITGRTKAKKQKYSTRCIYLSKKIVKCYLKEFGKIWYDKHNKGYTLCQKIEHDDSYGNNNDAASKFKVSLNLLCKKNNLKTFEYNSENLIFFRRGSNKVVNKKQFNDNSIFGRDDCNSLEEISVKFKSDKSREYNFYTKWYDFYFKSLRFDNLDVLDIEGGKESVGIWKKYFKNSTIHRESLDDNFFDIIIDSSNSDNDKVKTFKCNFKKLNFSGIYIIENLQDSYNNQLVDNIMGFLKDRLDDVNFHGKYNSNNIENIYHKKLKLNYYERNISSICFHSGICFIFKR